MICVHCNTPVPDHSKFCLACGSLVSDPDLQSAATQAMDDSATVQMETLLREDTEGEFEIGELIGRGGMAAVYLANEIHLSRRVAIKVLPPELTFGHGIERFKREAKIAAVLDHPNIIPIHRIASGGKVFWYSMKYLDGDTLDKMLQTKQQFTLDETTGILADVADALDYAHEHDVIHRDVKPANIMVDKRGRVVVTDFGIAKPLTEATLTASGSVVGTPFYMSPEQGAGRPVQGASDQYSLAVVAYEMLSGTRPFDGDSAIDVVHKHVMVEPPPLEERCPGLPQHVYAAVHKALGKKPEQRFATVREFVQGLKAPWVTPDTDDTLAEVPAAVMAPTTTTPAAVSAVEGETKPPIKAKEKPPLTGTLAVFVLALAAGAAWWSWWRLDIRQAPQNLENVASVEQQTESGDEPTAAAQVGDPPLEPTRPAADTTNPAAEQPARATTPATRPVSPRQEQVQGRGRGRRQGRLSVTGLPDSGSVGIDDGEESAARDFTLAPGRHILVLRAPGFETVVDTIRLSAGENLRIRYGGRPLPPVVEPHDTVRDSAVQTVPDDRARDLGLPAILVVRIRGGWANIFIDDAFKRRAQFTLPDTLAPGEHTISLRRPGFISVDTAFTLWPGERRMITIPIRRQR